MPQRCSSNHNLCCGGGVVASRKKGSHLCAARGIVCVGDSNAEPIDGEGHGGPLGFPAFAGVKTVFLLLRPFQLESQVLMQLADWGSVVDPFIG